MRNELMTSPFLRRALSLMGVILMVAFMAGDSRAIVVEKGDRIHISNLHKIDQDLYAFGQNLVMDGYINGDLISFSYDAVTNGEVRNSINVVAYDFRHTGRAGGSVRAFANTCVIDGYVGRSLVIMANQATVGRRAIVSRDVFMRGSHVSLGGTVNGNADLAGGIVTITGQVDGDLKIVGDNIAIMAPAIIQGNLTYISENEIEIDTDAGASVFGEIDWQLPEDEDEESSAFRDAVLRLSKMLAAFLFGVILMQLFRRHATESFHQLRTRFSVALAAGMLTVLVCLVSLLVLAFSLTLAIAGLSMISGDLPILGAVELIFSIIMIPLSSFLGISGGILFYSGKIVMATLIGWWIVRLFKREPKVLGKGQLLIGLLVLMVLFTLPLHIGSIIYVLASVIGTGAVVLGVRNCHRSSSAAEQTNVNITVKGDDRADQ